MPIKPSDLRVGDHVYTWSNGRTYSHHGIYVGDDRIVHFFADRVTMCSVNEFVEGKGSLRRYLYGVSQGTFEGRFRGGTCTFANSDPPEDVVDRARYLFWNGFGKYNIFKHNSEDFALYCKTGLLVPGKGVSGQVAFADNFAEYLSKAALALAPIAVSRAFIPFCAFRVGKLVGEYRADRCRKDIGMRIDAVKVEVKDIALVCGHGGFEDIAST